MTYPFKLTVSFILFTTIMLCPVEIMAKSGGDPQKMNKNTNTIGIQTTTAIAPPSLPPFVSLPVSMPIADQETVYEIAETNGVAFSLVMGMIKVETDFTRTARSETGDTGYMQINDCNLAEMRRRGFTDMYDTADNIGAGVSMLNDLFKKYGNEPHKVLMAYNLGEKKARKLWARGIETSGYSREVLKYEAEYSGYLDKHDIQRSGN